MNHIRHSKIHSDDSKSEIKQAIASELEPAKMFSVGF
jgi:hypothetical protein